MGPFVVFIAGAAAAVLGGPIVRRAGRAALQSAVVSVEEAKLEAKAQAEAKVLAEAVTPKAHN